jgi:transcription-repair coupling factor (superfamily II helicase)
MNPPLDQLTEALRASREYQALVAGASSARRLPVAAAAWVMELLAHEHERRLLVVVPHESDALAWVESARLFGGEASFFSVPGLTPYQETEVSLMVRAQEARALAGAADGTVRTLVCTPRALFRRLPTARAFRQAAVRVSPGDELPPEELATHLAAHGFERRDLVTEVGEFAARGGVFDVFPPGLSSPVRLDLFGDTVESIRHFGAADQRSQEQIDSVEILPLALFPADFESAEELAELISERLGAEAGIEVAEKVEALRDRGRFPGWENYLPLLEEETRGLADLFAGDLLITYRPEEVATELEAHAARLEADYEARRDHHQLALPPEELELPAQRVRDSLENAYLTLEGSFPDPDGVDFGATQTDVFHGQLPRFPREVETASARDERLLVVHSPEHRGRLEELCETYEMPLGRGGMELAEGELQRGFRLPCIGAVLFGEHQLFARVAPARPRRRPRYGPFVSTLRDLRVGDYVVHTDHGIGQFVGLRAVGDDDGSAAPVPATLGGAARGDAASVEVMELLYSGGRTLLLPLSRMDLIQKYSGIEGVAAKLDKLGGTSWSRTKARVKAGMRKLAGDLLKLYAERKLAKAPPMPPDSDLQQQFDAAFDYEETPDQHEAIEAIRADLQQERPMDRLLCGDVGFGKTEVAMRAALKAVEGGYQVAVLAPTTILADQHVETFAKRFEGFPVRIEMVSRFRSSAAVKEIAAAAAAGTVDILIGTHRLLSRDIDLPNLGLLIVDEEQRFGVAQKERLKELKKNVHVLALSATPVPRTLQLSLAGVRDLSVIETPPRDRMAVETAIAPFSGELIREAIEHEIDRGGQVYYVFNRVQGIEEIAEYLHELLPSLRITIGHGQMDEHELAERMHAFKRGEHDLLLATTIIENGIDISNVNTMIIHRADRFGLAQLYQLRGRVGRSNLLAYCYLLVPSMSLLSQTARQRLAAIREFTELGAGFRVAARDLEIRGAGNLLGAEQSGHIAAVGIETYLKMLEDTVKELRGEKVEEEVSTAIDLPVVSTIPESYVEDANLRMELYRRIAAAEEGEEELLAELRDRFGPPPGEVTRLVAVAALKRRAESLRVQSISARGGSLQIRLRADAKVDVERLIHLVSESDNATFSPSGVLTLSNLPPERMLPQARLIFEAIAE